MISAVEVIEKYNEFFRRYGNKRIDDYDTFIRSRVIEHFIPSSHTTIDELTEVVNTTIDHMGKTCPADSYNENWPSTSEDKKELPVFSDDSITSMKENPKKLSLVLIMIVVAGFLTYLFVHRKK